MHNLLRVSNGAAAALVVLATAFLAFSACDLFAPKNDFVFINDSDHTLAVSPSSQTSWEAFSLAPGNSNIARIPESFIQFTYDNAGYVNCDTSRSGVIDFRIKTILTVKNLTSSVELILVSWNGTYFGDDMVWSALLGKYVNGMLPGSVVTKEADPGSDYVCFWFAAGGPEYRTVSLLTVPEEEQDSFSFVDSTTVTPRSLAGTVFDIDDAVAIPDSSLSVP